MDKIIKIFIYCGFLSIFCISYAEETSTQEILSNKALALTIEANKLHNSEKWQNFVKQRELVDINFDLYRMHGPNPEDRVILAQDPKGYLVNKHNDMFCAPKTEKKCHNNSALYTYGDIKASILLQNYYNNPEEINLATEVMRNIINPFPSNVALAMRDATDQYRELPENKHALAQTYANQARLGVVRNSFNSMLLDRLSLGVLEGKPSAEKNQFSVLGIIEQEAKDRFENVKWQELIETSNQDLLLKEIAKMEAFKIWLEYHKYKQNERIEALLATMVAQQETNNQLLIEKNAKRTK